MEERSDPDTHLLGESARTKSRSDAELSGGYLSLFGGLLSGNVIKRYILYKYKGIILSIEAHIYYLILKPMNLYALLLLSIHQEEHFYCIYIEKMMDEMKRVHD